MDNNTIIGGLVIVALFLVGISLFWSGRIPGTKEYMKREKTRLNIKAMHSSWWNILTYLGYNVIEEDTSGDGAIAFWRNKSGLYNDGVIIHWKDGPPYNGEQARTSSDLVCTVGDFAFQQIIGAHEFCFSENTTSINGIEMQARCIGPSLAPVLQGVLKRRLMEEIS
ncbi:MAG: hypothetical protein KKC05_03935 [Nanoarchaeota archaeon]|nr:hypothetical protein [Nanoarchaeota archaeon]